MGQKVNPIGLRTGIIRGWDSKWYARNLEVPALIKEDYEIRKYLLTKFKFAGLSHIEIERSKIKDDKGVEKHSVRVTVYAAKQASLRSEVKKTEDNNPQKNPSYIDAANAYLSKLIKKEVIISTRGVVKPERVAYITACNIARDLEGRVSFRKAQKTAISKALRAGAKGIKTKVAGRLGGAEIARTEGYAEGRVPLHTLRADVDYATCEANTTYGKLGVKVWIYMGEVLPGMTRADLAPKPEKRPNQTYTNDRPHDNQNKGNKSLGKARAAKISEDNGGNE
ncbi:MAG: 30S ribosomal protein S3 [Acholeplasmatales bacterium]|jgi:small subunit ribosomal protein S3|nr:30S ribosomal protein S3 [Acholeplasmatales bacterium]